MGARSIKFPTDLSAREPKRVSSRAPKKRNLIAISESQQGEKNEPKGSNEGGIRREWALCKKYE